MLLQATPKICIEDGKKGKMRKSFGLQKVMQQIKNAPTDLNGIQE